jgi:fatty acid desaturase
MLSQRLSVVAFALTFYCLGTTYFEAFVNYRTWAFVGALEFPNYHRALTPLVAKVMLVPIAVYLACLVTLLVLGGPTLVPRWALTASLTLVLVAIASSVLIQIPIQRAFDRDALSTALLQRLIVSDLWLRKLPLGLNALLWVATFWPRSPSAPD